MFDNVLVFSLLLLEICSDRSVTSPIAEELLKQSGYNGYNGMQLATAGIQLRQERIGCMDLLRSSFAKLATLNTSFFRKGFPVELTKQYDEIMKLKPDTQQPNMFERSLEEAVRHRLTAYSSARHVDFEEADKSLLFELSQVVRTQFCISKDDVDLKNLIDRRLQEKFKDRQDVVRHNELELC